MKNTIRIEIRSFIIKLITKPRLGKSITVEHTAPKTLPKIILRCLGSILLYFATARRIK